MDSQPDKNDERDVEVFERIPWESLEAKPDRRWIAYVAAGAIVLGAVGVSLGRQMGRVPQPPVPTTAPATTLRSPEPPASTVVTALPEPVTIRSEADLMALPADSVEMGAAATAEWYVVDFLTRDEGEGGRSFVEWARSSRIEWESPSIARVTVLVRRLAAAGDDPYQRLPVETWEVTTELGNEGWTVIDGPIPQEPPELKVSAPMGDREWTDAAGIVWQVPQQ